MAPRRPKIRAVLPREVCPGDTVPIHVELTVDQDVRIDAVEVAFEGAERLTAGLRSARRIASDGAVLLEGGALEAGTTLLQWELEIPRGAPPSFAGSLARIDYELAVRVSIPWWPDARETFALQVGYPRDRPPSEAPTRAASVDDPSRASAARIELTVDRASIHPGQPLVGGVAVSGIDPQHVGAIELAVVRRETAPPREREAAVQSVAIPTAHGAEGVAYGFEVRTPKDLVGSFQAELCGIAWLLVAQVRLPDGSTVRAEIVLDVAPKPRAAVAPRPAPLAIGTERLQAVWSAVAEEADLGFDGVAMRGTRGIADVGVCREPSTRSGMRLSGALSYPPLDIELRIQPSELAGRHGGLQLGRAQWDGRHFIACGERAQWDVLSRVIKQPLFAFDAVYMDDLGARVSARDPGPNRARLARFVDQLCELAAAVARGRELIPPPAAVTPEMLDRWNALAAQLHSELRPASMAIAGHYHASPVQVRIAWHRREPIGAAVTVGVPFAVAREFLCDLVVDDGSIADQLRALVSSVPLEMLETALGGATRVQIGQHDVHVEFPAELAHDPRPLAARIPRIYPLVGFLRFRAGVYR